MSSNLTLKEINCLAQRAIGCPCEDENNCCCRCRCNCNCNCNCNCPCEPQCRCCCCRCPNCCKCKEHQEEPEEPEIAVTAVSLSAHNISAQQIRVEESGTAIPLPFITYKKEFEPNDNFKSFTVEESGTYSIDYVIYVNRETHLSAAVFKNGKEILGTAVEPRPPASSFIGTSIEFLEKGSQISLVLFGENIEVALQPRAGASLKIIRIA